MRIAAEWIVLKALILQELYPGLQLLSPHLLSAHAPGELSFMPSGSWEQQLQDLEQTMLGRACLTLRVITHGLG